MSQHEVFPGSEHRHCASPNTKGRLHERQGKAPPEIIAKVMAKEGSKE